MRFAPNSEEGGGGATRAPLPPSAGRPPRRVLAGAALTLAVLILAVVGLRIALRRSAGERIEAEARAYVTLALAVGRIAPGEVDAFFGPASLVAPKDSPPPTLPESRSQALILLDEIRRDHADAFAGRRAALARRVRQLVLLIDAIRADAPPRFDEEARRLYGVNVGAIDERPRSAILARLAALLPGSDPLPTRVAAFRARLAVPEARRAEVFVRALAECRRRTLAHWPLPTGERVEVRWSDAVPAAWHRYMGGGRSTLDVNPQAVAFVGAAIDLACHEAYPGHHAQFITMDQVAGKRGLPLEDRVVLLRSPESVLREGAANYGMWLAFPLADRVTFARDVLYPLAGLPSREAETDARVHQLLGELELSIVPIVRAYRDGALPFDAAAKALREKTLVASPEAVLRFVDQYGAFVVGYTLARDRVAAQVAVRSARARRGPWAVLRQIVATSDLSALAPVVAPADQIKPGS